jgi:hypothetical protein
MKKLSKLSLASIVYLVSSYAVVYADDKTTTGSFALQDPTTGLFDKSSKVIAGMFTAEWLIKGAAALFAISCFISAGNSARHGDYGKAVGAVIGGIISAIGAYLVSLSQH